MGKLVVYASFILTITACKNDKTSTTDSKSTPSITDTNVTSVPTTNNSDTTSSSNTWTGTQRTAFIKDCTVNMTNTMEQAKAADYCACMAKKMETAYPKYEDVAKMPEDTLRQLAIDCFK